MAGTTTVLPQDAVLLHIGPFKTGTTTIQRALAAARAQLPEHGARYAGDRVQHMGAALSLTGRPGRRGDPVPSRDEWDQLVTEVAGHPDTRVVVSSEFFCEVRRPVIPTVVAGLGGDRVHVVITLRPLARILASQWQQYVQNGQRVAYEKWLEAMFDDTRLRKPSPSFWVRHTHDEVVDRWAEVVGPERVHVIAVDDRDRDLLPRAFESLLDLPTGLLVPQPGMDNRSMTLGEAEMMRAVNRAYAAAGWPDAVYARYVREAVVKHLLRSHQPGPDEEKIQTPDWAVKRAAEIGTHAAERISASGVHVIGDLSILGAVPDLTDPVPSEAAEADTDPEPTVPASEAAAAITNLIAVGEEARLRAERRAAAELERALVRNTREARRAALETASGRVLLRVALQRLRRRLSGRDDRI